MRWLVEDLVEAALGPWALALGAGVALLMLARRRDGVTRWWRQVYDETAAEWRAAHVPAGGAAPPRLRRSAVRVSRARDERGRFVGGRATASPA